MSPDAREPSFDELARGLASGSLTRGKALRLMGAALVGGTLASLGIGEASADLCKPNGKVCKKNSQCCSGNCAADGTCSAAGCPTGTVQLSNGTCARPCGNNFDCAIDGCLCGCPCFSNVSLTAAYCGSIVDGGCTSDTDCLSGTCGSLGFCECTSDAQCPSGQFCSVNADCRVAC